MTGMFKSEKAPKPQDASVTIAQTNAQKMAEERRALAYNRPDQVDSFANRKGYRQTGTDEFGNPTFEQYQTMGDEAKGYAAGLGALGERYFTGANAMLDKGFGGGIDAQANEYFGKIRDNLVRQQENQTAAAHSTLVNRGLTPGTEAYDNAMRSLVAGQGDALNNAYAGARNQALQEATSRFGTELGGLQSLTNPGVQYMGRTITGDQAALTPIQVGQTDVAGITNANYQQQLAAWQANQQQQNALLGGLGGIGGTILGLGTGGGGTIGGGIFKGITSMFK